MTFRRAPWQTVSMLLLLPLPLASCVGFGEETLGGLACPELQGPQGVLGVNFSADARASGKVGAFVQASKDMAGVSFQIEAEVAEACLRMGTDLGLSPAQMAARGGAGGKAAGACGAVSARIDAILRQGVRVRVAVTPPQCQASAGAEAQCQGSCEGSAQGAVRGPSASGSSSAECQGSCRAHANVNASCSPALVSAQVAQGDAGRLAATLQANLPLLLHAELALGRRLAGDIQTVGQIGAQLPRVVGNAGARALACVAAAADVTASASARINVSVQASASVSGKVGGLSPQPLRRPRANRAPGPGPPGPLFPHIYAARFLVCP